MNRNFRKFLVKVFLLTTFIVLVFTTGPSLLNAFTNKNNSSENTNQTNKNTFQSTEIQRLWKTWVALAINVWTRYTQISQTPAYIYSDALWISQLLQNEDLLNTDWWIIAENMLITQEYKNVLKTDIKSLLANTYDKAEMLDSIIWQLQYRYILATNQIKTLISQRAVFEKEMTDSVAQNEILKTKIDADFQKNNATFSVQNIENYVELKNKYYYAKIYVVFINQFLNDYNILNEYNKGLLDTLINNKDAITKDAYIVIPDSWVDFLRDFNLLYEESDYKNSQNSEN